MRKKMIMSLPGILISLCAIAQDSTKVTTLQEVVVSATRTEQPIIETPRSVTVIGQEELSQSIYNSLGELLNAQSGFYVVGANQTPGTNQNIFMRGANSNHVAVMIDGVRITDPSSPNAAIDLSELSLANVERIEIIRGSHSTMFGGAAIGGVINIITKGNGTPGLHGNVHWQGGYFGRQAGLSKEQLNLSFNSGNGWYINGSLFQENVNGLDATEKTASFTADRDDFAKTDASVKAGFKKDKMDAYISYKRASQRADVDNGAFMDDDNYYLTFDRNLLEYRMKYHVNRFWRFSVLGSFSDSERFYENDSSQISAGRYDKTYSTGTYYGKLQTHEIQFNYARQKVKGVIGAGMYGEEMLFDNYLFYNDPNFPFELVTNYDTLDTRTTTQYVFGQVSYDMGDFSIAAGSRLSHHSMAGDHVTVEVNPAYRFGDHLLVYGSLSTGYNAPSLYQLYDPSRGFAAYTTRGNANLKPEQSVSIEAGVKKEFSNGSYVTVSGYQTSVSNAIEYVFLWNGSKPVAELDYTDDRGDTYLNIARQDVAGFELEGFVVLTDKLALNASITALKGHIEVNPEDLNDQPTGGHHVQVYNLGTFLTEHLNPGELVRRPHLTSFARLRFMPTKNVSFTVSHRYAGDRFDAGYDGTLGPYGALARLEVDGYHLVDVGIHWQISKVFSAGIKGENILNERYREVTGFQTRGRSGYLKLMVRF